MLNNPVVTGLSCYPVLFNTLSCYELVGTLMGKVVGMFLEGVRTGSTLTHYENHFQSRRTGVNRRAILFCGGGFTVNNDTTPAKNLQGLNAGQNANFHKLDMVSVNALVPLSSAVFELADKPLHILSYLHKFLSHLYEQDREQDCIDILYLVYSVLGIEYADAMVQIRKHPEAQSYFLYGFIANIAELIEELSERSGA